MVNISTKIKESYLTEGDKLFSLAYGEVVFYRFEFLNNNLVIHCKKLFGDDIYYDKYGCLYNKDCDYSSTVCDLYPYEAAEQEYYNDKMWDNLPKKEASKEVLEKLKEIAEPAPSDWKEHAKWRQENRYWTRYSGCVALYLFMNKGGTCGVHDYIKNKLGCDDSTVRQICKGDYDFKLSEVLKLVTPEELSNIISGGYKYFNKNNNPNLEE